MKTTAFTIVRIHCVSCVARNEWSLKKIKGVHDAVIEFDESILIGGEYAGV